MNFSKSFTYMFDDPNWASKYTIGILISLVPILNFAWFGYAIGIMRNIAKGETYPLPTWDNIGEKFKDGLFVAIASFVYTLPLTLVMCILWGVMILPAVFQENADMASALAGVGTLVWLVVGCCAFVYILVYSFFYPALMIHYSRLGTFNSLFQVNAIIKLATGHMSEYLLGWLAGLVAGAILGVVAAVPCLGQIVAAVAGAAWLNTVTGYAFGQVGLQIGNQPAPVQTTF